MFKYLLLIGTTATVGYFAWQKYTEKSVVATPKPAPITTQAVPTKEETFKSAELHDAFAKILDKENSAKAKPRKRLSIDELIAVNLKTGSTRMSGNERKKVISTLKLDIKELEKKYADADESVDENEIEIKIGHKREQLENFENIESQFPGVNFEN